MKLKIGFSDKSEEVADVNAYDMADKPRKEEPRKSVVRVYFEEKHFACSYYNDMFDLKKGDTVFVEGKLEGLKGIVVEVSYSYKIKLSDYKKVISKSDTDIHGKLCQAGNYFIAYDRNVIPFEKLRTWYKPPITEEEYDENFEGDPILLSNLENEKIPPYVLQSGKHIFSNNKVLYLSVENSKGHAIVEDGGVYHEIEFVYESGYIGDVFCDCFNVEICEHGAAVLYKLKELIELSEKKYSRTELEYIAAVEKTEIFNCLFNVENQTEITF